MIATADEPALRACMHRISVETYHRLGEMELLGERTELIHGIIIDQMPKSPLHSAIVRRLDRYLLGVLPAGYTSRAEQPLTFIDSEPEPDIAVVRGDDYEYDAAHPRGAELVIEVCVTTEEIDRVKLGLYAEAGVPECWLVLAGSRVLERHTQPSGSAYQHVAVTEFPALLESTVVPELLLPQATLFRPQ